MHVSYVPFPTDWSSSSLHRHLHRVAFKHQRKLCVFISWRNSLLIGKFSLIFNFEEIKRNRKNRDYMKIGKMRKWLNLWLWSSLWLAALRRCVRRLLVCLCDFEFLNAFLRFYSPLRGVTVYLRWGCWVEGCYYVLIMNWEKIELWIRLNNNN